MLSGSKLNPSRVTRRQLLSTCLTGAAAWAVAGRKATAIEPLRREGSKFKFSLAAYSYRQLLQGDSPQLTLFDFVDDCARFGLEGTELTSYYFPAEVTSEYLRQLKGHCFRLGLDVSGTAVGNDFGFAEGPERDAQLQLVKRWVDHAELLGAPVIRIFAGHAHGDTSPDELHRRIVNGIEQCCQYAGEHGVYLALENHGGPTTTADGLLALVRDVQSPWFGVNLDTGNFQGDDVYGDLQRAAPYAVNVQVKVSISSANGGRQSSDYRRLAQILQASHYRGYIALEFEEAGDPRSECPRHLDAIRAAFGH